jgi:hypothetical protein
MCKRHGTSIYARETVSNSVASAQKLGAIERASWSKGACYNLCYRAMYENAALQILSTSFKLALSRDPIRSCRQLLLVLGGTLAAQAG